jgi:hypothetical protein
VVEVSDDYRFVVVPKYAGHDAGIKIDGIELLGRRAFAEFADQKVLYGGLGDLNRFVQRFRGADSVNPMAGSAYAFDCERHISPFTSYF